MNLPYLLNISKLQTLAQSHASSFQNNLPFPHIVIDDFLEEEHVNFLMENFPKPDHDIWLNWKKRSPFQYGKQGVGNSDRFYLLDDELQMALLEFNSSKFLTFLENLTGIKNLLPDPHFTGGGFHQIVKGGILDIHTDFNYYSRLKIFRRLNVLIYLTEEWKPEYNGQLELWDSDGKRGQCQKRIPPIKNRCVIFYTNKNSFHGHPYEWKAPEGMTRRSIALYYYTAQGEKGEYYDEITDFQDIIRKELPKELDASDPEYYQILFIKAMKIVKKDAELARVILEDCAKNGSKGLSQSEMEQTYLVLSYISLQQSEFNRGIIEIQKCLELNPNNKFAIMSLIKSYISLGSIDEARTIIRKELDNPKISRQDRREFIKLQRKCEELSN